MAFVHPSFFEIDDANSVRVPVALIPSSGEDKDMINGFWDKIQQNKDIAAQSVRLDFVSRAGQPLAEVQTNQRITKD
jgi:hypothetical protein